MCEISELRQKIRGLELRVRVTQESLRTMQDELLGIDQRLVAREKQNQPQEKSPEQVKCEEGWANLVRFADDLEEAYMKMDDDDPHKQRTLDFAKACDRLAGVIARGYDW